MLGYGYSLDEMLPDEDDADAGASGSTGGDSSGDPENDWWIAVVAGAAAGLGILSVGFCVYAGCRRRGNGKEKGAPTKKASVEDGDGGGSAPETKAETKSETKAEAMAQRA